LRSWRWAKVCPKHVELILEINKTVIVASSRSSIFTLPIFSKSLADFTQEKQIWIYPIKIYKTKDTWNIQLQIFRAYDSHLNHILAHSVGNEVSEGRACCIFMIKDSSDLKVESTFFRSVCTHIPGKNIVSKTRILQKEILQAWTPQVIA
jgi:hypothetical protein